MRVCKFSDERPPHVTRFGVAVEKDHGIPFARDQIVKTHAVDVGNPFIDHMIPFPRFAGASDLLQLQRHGSKHTQYGRGSIVRAITA
jgi:hypothetical protein